MIIKEKTEEKTCSGNRRWQIKRAKVKIRVFEDWKIFFDKRLNVVRLALLWLEGHLNHMTKGQISKSKPHFTEKLSISIDYNFDFGPFDLLTTKSQCPIDYHFNLWFLRYFLLHFLCNFLLWFVTLNKILLWLSFCF